MLTERAMGRKEAQANMIDVSLRSLQRRITGDANLLAQVARIWLVLPGNVDDAGLLKMVLTQMQSPFAARSVWEQLANEERRLLYAVLEDKDRAKGVPRARLQKKTRLPAAIFDAALFRLKKSLVVAGRRNASRQKGFSAGPRKRVSSRAFPCAFSLP